MKPTLTPATIAKDPACATTTFKLKSGESLTFRPLRVDDVERLTRYFGGLSARTRGWFAPHEFTAETARGLCHSTGVTGVLRMVAVLESDQPTIVAYFILQFGARQPDGARFDSYGVPLDAETDCTVAPSVADGYQNVGVGSALMRHVIDLARKAGRTRMVLFGGVNASNQGAVHFYGNFGFRTVATFGSETEKYDMIMDLTA